jgi:predicted DNA-binding protein (UPF0251 family)
MARPKKSRKICCEPVCTCFKPVGAHSAEETNLALDELEAVRLKDFLGNDQDKAAKQMKISQPTFNRLLMSARKKLADAVVNGKTINVEGRAHKPLTGTICACLLCGNTQPKMSGSSCSQMECKICSNKMTRE